MVMSPLVMTVPMKEPPKGIIDCIILFLCHLRSEVKCL